jgi:hypothetical protein
VTKGALFALVVTRRYNTSVEGSADDRESVDIAAIPERQRSLGGISPIRLGSRIASRFKGVGLTEDIPELRGQPVQPAQFNGS